MLYSLSFVLTRGNSTMRYMKLELRFSLYREIQLKIYSRTSNPPDIRLTLELQGVSTWINVTDFQLTSLIISISLKVKRSSQSTFTMWPCRCAFVSWTEKERRVREQETGFTDIRKNVELRLQQYWSQHGGWCANSSTSHAQIQC